MEKRAFGRLLMAKSGLISIRSPRNRFDDSESGTWGKIAERCEGPSRYRTVRMSATGRVGLLLFPRATPHQDS